MSRAISLNDACRTLRLPYTYQVVRVPLQKQAARKQIGGMAVEIIETMRDEFLEAAVSRYLASRGLTQQSIDAIFGEANGEGTTGINLVVDRVEECKVEATGAIEEAGHSELSHR